MHNVIARGAVLSRLSWLPWLPRLVLASCVPASGEIAETRNLAEGRPYPASDSSAIAFVGADVLPMTDGFPLLHDQTVIVTGDRIASVGSREGTVVPEGARRIDASGRFLVPGLADMHVHLEYFEGRPELLALFVASGVTTVRNMDGRPHVLAWRDSIARGEMPGPAIFTAGPLLDGDPPLLPDNLVVADAPAARAAVARQARAGFDFVKVYTNLPASAYVAVLAEARSAGLAVAGHVPRGVGLGTLLDGGQRTLEHLQDFTRWIAPVDSAATPGWMRRYLAGPVDTTRLRAVARGIASAGIWVTPTLAQAQRDLAPRDSAYAWLADPAMENLPAFAREAWDPAGWEDWRKGAVDRMDGSDWAALERGGAHRALVARVLHESGVPLLAGSDTPNPYLVPGDALHLELDMLRSAGLPPDAVLAAATRNAARALGDESWGSIVPGQRADILLLDSNPLASPAALRRPLGVLLRGRWLTREALDAALDEALAAGR